jgi:2-polyprenyl-6-methoxyphenol hydroxylase-like FAD-dependent oxidoreductase
MTEEFDVIVVGARCAGSPLAALLARRGVKVALVEQATFPCDTLSTHILEAEALAFLERLGVMHEIRATGAPLIDRVDARQEDLEYITTIPQPSGGVGGTASVRRTLLDPILAQAAAEAGADLRMASKVTGLVEERGRVAGVRLAHNDSQTTLRARLVVGADGRKSTIAGLVGARKYNLTPNERFAYWSFFEGVPLASDPAFVFHRWDDRLVIATHADSGLYQVMISPDLRDLARFRDDLEGSFMEYARSCRPGRRRFRALTGLESSSGCCAGRGSSERRLALAGCWWATPDTSRTQHPAKAYRTRFDRSTRSYPRSSARWMGP